MAGKSPSEQFYFKDWLTDAALQAASSSTRGIWINVLCFMWWNGRTSEITGTKTALARMWNCTLHELNRFLKDAETSAFCQLGRNPDGTLTVICRRIQREQKARKLHRLRQKKYYARRKADAQADAKLTNVFPTPIYPSTNVEGGKDPPENLLANLLNTDSEFKTLFNGVRKRWREVGTFVGNALRASQGLLDTDILKDTLRRCKGKNFYGNPWGYAHNTFLGIARDKMLKEQKSSRAAQRISKILEGMEHNR